MSRWRYHVAVEIPYLGVDSVLQWRYCVMVEIPRCSRDPVLRWRYHVAVEIPCCALEHRFTPVLRITAGGTFARLPTQAPLMILISTSSYLFHSPLHTAEGKLEGSLLAGIRSA